mgnify:FL=1|jgi:hypothetical protein
MNQRFRVYIRFFQDRIGNVTFTHFVYVDLSSYLLVNLAEGNIDIKELRIKEMFERTYNIIPDVTA